MPKQAQGAVIEIIEKRPAEVSGVYSDVIVPNEVRINGQALLMPQGSPVRVHEVEIRERDAVLVTLTVFAKRVTFGVEESEAGRD
jgi:hypothetical protein